jgi:hypothetical protein
MRWTISHAVNGKVATEISVGTKADAKVVLVGTLVLMDIGHHRAEAFADMVLEKSEPSTTILSDDLTESATVTIRS